MQSLLIRRIRTVLAVVLLALVLGVVPALAAGDFGAFVPGQYIYDRAGLLTADEIANLQTHAAAVERAGAPVVVYLQKRDASQDETQQDARDLMDTWDLQSAPDARDGLVFFFNLKPDDPRHGEVALFGGKTLVEGNLPQRELARIYEDVMLPDLKAGRTAQAIAAGLDAAAHDLTFGPPPPPPPSAFERLAADLTSGALSVVNLLAVAVAVAVGLLAHRRWRARPTSPAPVVPTTMPPGDLPPAVAGALVTGHVGTEQAEATILDLARRGALAIEPAGLKKIQVRLLDSGPVRGAYEQAIWNTLTNAADVDQVVSSGDLGRLRGSWSGAGEVLKRQLLNEGLFDPQASARRAPLYLAGVVTLVLMMAAVILTVVGGHPWGGLGAGILFAAGVGAFFVAASIPNTTERGESEAAPWRGYRAGIKAARRDPTLALNLDDVMPYAVALGVAGWLDRRLKDASQAGYSPLWLGQTHQPGVWVGGFYPYWAVFHTSVAPPSSSGGTAGGASAGGAGAGGSF